MLLGSFRDVVSFDVVSTTITIGADADVPLLWLLGISALLSFVRIIGYEFGRTSMIGSFYGMLIMDCYLSSYDISSYWLVYDVLRIVVNGLFGVCTGSRLQHGIWPYTGYRYLNFLSPHFI